MECSKCGRRLQAGNKDCFNCEEPVVFKLKKKHNGPMLVLTAVLTVGVLLAVVVAFFNNGNYAINKDDVLGDIQSAFSDSFDENEDYNVEWEDEETYEEEQQEGTVVQTYTPAESTPVNEKETMSSTEIETDVVSTTKPSSIAAETGNTYEDDASSELHPEIIDDFYQDYRENYSEALNSIEFWKVEPYLSPSGSAYGEMEAYLEDIKDYGSQFYFYENRITDYYMQDSLLYIEAYEAFDLMDRDGETTSHQRDKSYAVVLNYNYVPVLIDSIEITNHYR